MVQQLLCIIVGEKALSLALLSVLNSQVLGPSLSCILFSVGLNMFVAGLSSHLAAQATPKNSTGSCYEPIQPVFTINVRPR